MDRKTKSRLNFLKTSKRYAHDIFKEKNLVVASNFFENGKNVNFTMLTSIISI